MNEQEAKELLEPKVKKLIVEIAIAACLIFAAGVYWGHML